MSKAKLKIGIAGAGIMGRMLAFRLLNDGHQVTLFDRDSVESGSAAAFTAAGMLTPFAEIEAAELAVFHMGMLSLKLWPKLIKSLKSDVGFYQLGSLIIAHGEDKADLKRFNQQLQFKLAQQNLLNDTELPQMIDRAELTGLEPSLSQHFLQATYLPQEAWLCTKRVMDALAEYLLERKIHWHAHTLVEQVTPHFITAQNQKHHFDLVIDSRGLGAKQDINGLRGVRGELITLQAPEVKINHLIRLMHPRYRLYLVPKMQDDLYIIGATQIESCDFSPISVRSTLELLSAVYSLHSGFAEARVINTKTNCRPALSHNLPRVEYFAGMLRINGLFRHGFLLAPVIADEVSFFIKNQQYQSPFKGLFCPIDYSQTG